MIDSWLEDVKKDTAPEELGMILVHNGVVRATSKQGAKVEGMVLSYDEARLAELLKQYRQQEGIVDIKAWINSGRLGVGDNIMYLLVAGRFRTDIMPVFDAVLSTIKKEVVKEQEL